ncbi:crossover junction endodeoxyribonuclease RuvC [Candidatus Cyanaurora vandensis]|uniref:crossover junction endodeoxyribonuclease RuvC n=1 Tax=Candidatus Cyanaurora vandensis TaxID=2714958 RepID=UPI002579FC99|nr:crossover junction endodeoxyribonuclease RuvC [Candidatus Cyanaurora vandensis]
MRILGIDPGLATIGYGVLDVEERGGRVQLQDYGVITTPPTTAMDQRLALIHQDITALLQQWEPGLVVLEKFFFYRMANTILIAQARGVILLCLGQHGATYIEFSPPQVKQFLTGYGRATKQQVQEAVQRELTLSTLPRPDDAADALALALTGHLTYLPAPAGVV